MSILAAIVVLAWLTVAASLDKRPVTLGQVSPEPAFCCGGHSEALGRSFWTSHKSPPSSSAPFIPSPMVLSMAVEPSASYCWGSRARQATVGWGTHRKVIPAAFHSVHWKYRETREKIAHPGQAKKLVGKEADKMELFLSQGDA